MIKVSIIIPVYKTEPYISQCINSVLPFLNHEIECIFVDDGSPDHAIDIVKSLIEGKNAKIIQQPNSGLSVARNNGIRQSKGEYIFFLDSDDWIEGDIISLYNYSKLNNLDILAFNYKKYYESNRALIYTPKHIPNKVFSGPDFFYYLQKKNKFSELAQLYLFKRDFLLTHNLYFLEGIKHEDNEFTPRAILLSERIAYLEEPIYIYRKRENSITTTVDPKRLYDLILITENLEQFHNRYQEKNVLISKSIAIYGTRIIRKVLYLHALLKNTGQTVEGNVKKIVQNSFFFKKAISRCDVLKVKCEGLIIINFYSVCLYLYQTYIKIRDYYAKSKNCSHREK